MRLARRLRQHLGWPLALLLASLGVAGLAAVQAQRASSSHRRTAARLLQDYAAIAAWSYARRAEQALGDAAWQVLNPILHREMHSLLRWPDAADLVEYRDTSLALCRCDPIFRPATYMAWSLGADTIGTAGVRLDAAAERALLDTLTPHIRGTPRGVRGGLVVARVRRAATLVAYGIMPMSRGDTMVYAFTFDSASVTAGLRDVARRSELLPSAVTRGLSNDSLLALCISPPGGPTFFTSGRFPQWKLQADAQLSPVGGRLAVHATVRPEVAAALVAGGLPSAGRTAYLVALVTLSGGLALLAFRQLRREQQLARLRADFVAGVSHELRTPLAQMRMFLETLRLGRWQTDEQRDWLLGHVDRETARLSHLVENVLAFAAMSRERGAGDRPARSLPRDVADVGAEVTEAARAFAPLALARQATLRVDADGDTAAPLDRARFRQVLLNLLDNAVKYGPSGQIVTVRVARAAAGDGASVVRVTVDDEGPGVPRAERARVWDSYFRGAGEGTRVAGGSGIGLAIVRQIVAAHGGRAWVDDAPGGGARVVVELPACDRAPADDAACGAPAGEEPAVAAAVP